MSAVYIAIQEVAASWSTDDEPDTAWRVAAHDGDGQPTGRMNVETGSFAEAVKWAKSMRGLRDLPVLEIDTAGKLLCVVELDADAPAGDLCAE
jgi:hypothetical protein